MLNSHLRRVCWAQGLQHFPLLMHTWGAKHQEAGITFMVTDKLSTSHVIPVVPQTLNTEARVTQIQHSPNSADCDSLLFSSDVNTACELQQLTLYKTSATDYGTT